MDVSVAVRFLLYAVCLRLVHGQGGFAVSQPELTGSASLAQSGHQGMQTGGSSSYSAETAASRQDHAGSESRRTQSRVSYSSHSSSSVSSGSTQQAEAAAAAAAATGRRQAESGSASRAAYASSSSSSSSSVAADAAVRDATRDGTGLTRQTESRPLSEKDTVAALATDKEQQSYFKDLISQRCKDCVVNGTSYRGHSRFEYTEGCNHFRCICNCDGSFSCPPRYTIDACKDGGRGGAAGGDEAAAGAADSRRRTDVRRRRCETCQAFGKEFPGNAYFDAQDGCTKYRGCLCYCNGTWNCPSERAIDTCRTTPPPPTRSSCGPCNAKGKVVAGNSYFELEEPCKMYRYCRCYCDGSWQCPDQFVEDTCKSPDTKAEDTQHPGCQKCNANGQEVQGNSYFQLRDGCTEFKNCVCRCNGSWTCPSQYAKNVCPDQAGVNQTAGKEVSDSDNATTVAVASQAAECKSCLVHGKYFRGNTYFSTRQGCRQYERCVCRCDGSWDCPDRYASDLCSGGTAPPSLDGEATCSFCDAKGKVVPPNSFFNLTDGCVHHEYCLCHCDGAWSCPERYARRTCDETTQQAARQTAAEDRDCGTCQVEGRVVRGNTRFDRVSQCFRYRDCLCKCDGSFQCPADRAESICQARPGAATSASSSASSQSSSSVSSSATLSASSSSSAAGEAAAAAAAAVAPSSQCVRCFAFGLFRAPGRRFRHDEGCYEYECECHCNGTYVCPAERARNTCARTCRECELGGQFFEGNTMFRHTQGCSEFQCTCHCNGTYACQSEGTTRTNCSSSSSSASAISSSSSGKVVISESVAGRSTATDLSRGAVGGRCNQCTSNDGRTHAPNIDFVLQQGCINYMCRCNCDGSWNCPGHTARNVCRGEVLGGCRSCVISESRIYRGDEDFQMREGCIHYNCRCNCDGSWECPGQQARDICLGEVPGGCRVCRVSQNETYRANSQFQLRQGCIHYQCNCHCNGSWECPGDTAKDVCIGEVPGGCRVCKLEGGEIYLGESDFRLQRGCIDYRCRCKCDGSWECPGERAKWVCDAPSSTSASSSSGAVIEQPESRCTRCVVSDTEQFDPDHPFSIRRGCLLYQCECRCDGSWQCPGERSRNMCDERREEDTAELRAQTCDGCQVSSYTYPGRSTFLLTRDCSQYACQCQCNGRWSCNHTAVRNICSNSTAARTATAGAGYTSSGQRASSFSSVMSATRTGLDQRAIVSPSTQQRSVSTARGSSVAEANVGSYRPAAQTAQSCRPCKVDGQTYSPDSDFTLEKKCKRFNCHCRCNGRWLCPRERTEDLCAEDGTPLSADRRRASASFVSTSSAEAGGQRYGATTNIRVVGTDSSSSSSSSSSDSSSSSYDGAQDAARGGTGVRGYYVSSAAGAKPAGRAAAYSQTGQASSYSSEQAGAEQNQDRGRAQAHGESGQLLVRTGHAYFQDSARSAQAFVSGQVSGQPTGTEEAAAGWDAEASSGQCTPCLVDEKVYQTGAQFDWRRGCIVYKCSCMCSGSYRCRLSVERGCNQQQQLPAEGGAEGCGNCFVHGYVYPGNMSFALRQGCQELSCRCRCDGTHNCDEPRPIQGCTGVSTAAGGNDGYQPYSAVLPLGAGGYAVRPGRLVNSYQQTFHSGGDCPTCGGAVQYDGSVQPVQHAGGYLIPALVAVSQGSDGQLPLDQQQYLGIQQTRTVSYQRVPLVPVDQAEGAYVISGARSNNGDASAAQSWQTRHQTRSTVQVVPMVPVDTPGEALMDSGEDKRCATCLVDGRLQRGSFQFSQDCYHVSCYCDCAGSLRCSLQQDSRDPARCPAQYGPLTGQGCRSCVVRGHEYPPTLQFALRVGCHGYECTCDCAGNWMCPTQQPSNYCARPQSATGVGLELDPLAPDRRGPKSELRDATYTRSTTGALTTQDLETMSVRRKDDVTDDMLDCQDCDVRGTMYPSRKEFILKDGCLQHTCRCLCDGSWSCRKNATVDVCAQDRLPEPRAGRTGGQDEAEDAPNDQRGSEMQDTDRNKAARAVAASAARRASEANSQADEAGGCRSCSVGGKHYLANADFHLRQGRCHLRQCTCHCNGTHHCPASRIRNVCRPEAGRQQQENPQATEGCSPCLLGNRTYPGDSSFTYRDGCWQFGCQCGCNGAAYCPPRRTVNMCQGGGGLRGMEEEESGGQEGLAAALTAPGGQGTDRRDRPQDAGSCQPCMVDGTMIRARTAFNQRRGCIESLCHCACNGTWWCPDDQTYDMCNQEGDPSGSDATAPSPRKGCTVGRTTYFTRLFAYNDGCIQHFCICHDTGVWRCPPGKERHIC